MSSASEVKRQITIKTGVVKRLVREEQSYIKEAEEQEARVAKYESEGKEEWEVKKQREVLQQCRQMIPDCRNRLLVAVEDLQGLLESAEGTLHEEDVIKAANEALGSAALSVE